MSKSLKTMAMFFVVMLFFLSIYTQNNSVILTSHLENTQSENTVSYFSTEKPELIFIDRHEERQVNSVKNLPIPSFKNQSNNINYNCLSPEIRIANIDSEYLSYSEIVERSMTNSDKVFPFHYFW
jgi:hypothetical protein